MMTDAAYIPRGPMVPGWPVIDDGLRMAWFGRIALIHLDHQLTDASFGRYLHELARAFEVHVPGTNGAILYSIPTLPSLGASRRRAIVDVLKPRLKGMRGSVLHIAVATPSPVVRGIANAVFWMLAPAFPITLAETTDEALAAIRPHMLPGECEQWRRGYDQMLRPRVFESTTMRVGSPLPSTKRFRAAG